MKNKSHPDNPDMAKQLSQPMIRIINDGKSANGKMLQLT